LVAVVAAVLAFRRPPAPSLEFTLEPPDGYTFFSSADPTLSPDGRWVACVVADSGGTPALALRSMARSEMRVLPGTSGANSPFWAPDGRQLAFFAQGKLLRMALDGSPPITVADAPDARGGTWTGSGDIVFAPNSDGDIFKVASSGGAVRVVTRRDVRRGENAHRYPVALPDGKRFLFIALDHHGKKWLCAGDVSGGPIHVVGETENVAIPAVPGWVITEERRRVVARSFDSGALKLGAANVDLGPCAGDIKIGHANLGADRGGTVVYQAPLRASGWLRWVDANGQPLGPRSRELDTPTQIVPSPDLTKVTFVSEDNDFHLLDLARGVPTRLTFLNLPQEQALYSPAWSPDSRRIAYAAENGTVHDRVHVLTVDSGSDTTIFEAPSLFAAPTTWTPDGKAVVAWVSDTLGSAVWTLPPDGEGNPGVFMHGDEYVVPLRFSPDGRWLACIATVHGHITAAIISWPKPSIRHLLTLDFDLPTFGRPIWWEGENTLAVIDSRGRLLAIPVQLEGGFQQGEPRVVFTPAPGTQLIQPSPDLNRFLVLEEKPNSNPAPLRVLTAWTTGRAAMR
jgi:Tol biopolymer transport system component